MVSGLPVEVQNRLRAGGLDPADLQRVVATAIAEDMADGVDVTTVATIPADQIGVAEFVCRSEGVVAGLIAAEAVFAITGASGAAAERVQRPVAVTLAPDPLAVVCAAKTQDGERVTAGQTLMVVTGPMGVILTAERTALNLVCHLSGVATLTRRWVDAVGGTGARIRDTRKTLPGLRSLEKYAVRCGGGVNHRMSLGDAALIKDNHVAAAGSVTAALRAVRERFPDVTVEVECDTLEQVAEAVAAGAELILLDNFGVEQMAKAVALVAGRAELEASGGLRLSEAAAVAGTGVDFLAVGALTHSAAALDVGLDIARADR